MPPAIAQASCRISVWRLARNPGASGQSSGCTVGVLITNWLAIPVPVSSGDEPTAIQMATERARDPRRARVERDSGHGQGLGAHAARFQGRDLVRASLRRLFLPPG